MVIIGVCITLCSLVIQIQSSVVPTSVTSQGFRRVVVCLRKVTMVSHVVSLESMTVSYGIIPVGCGVVWCLELDVL